MDEHYRNGAVIYLYVLGASDDPENVQCHVPWAVDNDEIFFGPCKKSLRQHFKSTVLREKDEVVPENDIYVVGLNALPSPTGPRKVVWAGKINRLMTFAVANDRLVGERYQKMLDSEASPLNVAPVRDSSGKLLGYRFRPRGHHPKNWQRDLISTGRGTMEQGEEVLLLRDGVLPHLGFARDLCFIAKNLFFARGKGLEIDEEAVALLKVAQREADGIDSVAVFGKGRDGKPDGRRGRYLRISESESVERFLGWLHTRKASLEKEI